MNQARPHIPTPTAEELRELADRHYLDLSESEIEDFRAVMDELLTGYARLDVLNEPTQERVHNNRDSGYRVGPEGDSLNAIVTSCRVEGAPDGPLSGYSIGVKDNVTVRGVEMTVGSKLFEGYVPQRDATIVTRLLDAGGTITCKTNMEALAYSGSGEMSFTGPVLNPVDQNYLAGGSSGGSAAAVVHGDVDVAIGGDQGGSIRMPASWCGAVGHKPTHGLVPYTGIVGLGYSFDYAGPITTNVADSAKVLDVIAGKDPLDPRQGEVRKGDYTGSLSDDPSEVTIGVLSEGFQHEVSEEEVNETVRTALDEFEDAGATVDEISIPMHFDALPIFNSIVQSETTALYHDEGIGRYGKGFYDTQFADAFAKARRTQAKDLPPTVKLTLMLGEYLSEQYRDHYYAKAKNLNRKLIELYNEALAEVDVLAMPTTPHRAHEVRDDLSRLEMLDRALSMIGNTAPFNITGHPAISVPAGESDGLPVGLMFVGDQFDDETVFSAASAFENGV